MTQVFSSKLDRIPETVKMATSADVRALADALLSCVGVPAVAVGSGGSAVAAEFLAACRQGLSHGPTIVATPMALVSGSVGDCGAHIWLFSASGTNQDIVAALDCALMQPSTGFDVVTSNPDSLLSVPSPARRTAPARSHVCPVADPKDGFLATHSLISAITSLVVATDIASDRARQEERFANLAEMATKRMSASFRSSLRKSQLSDLQDRDTLLLLHDPHLAAAAVLVETSFWEAGICAVQRADFRNFAHGRHVWLTRHAQRTFVLAITTDIGRSAWMGIRQALPADVALAELDFGRAGRGAQFDAVLASLAVVEAAGAIKGVDPGKPGVQDFGRTMFDRGDLRDTVGCHASRSKRKAEAAADPLSREETDWIAGRNNFVQGLAAADVRAIVLDYDGTVVHTHDREAAPGKEIVDSLEKLTRCGIRVAFATGRGGSIGQKLRGALAPDLHDQVIIGYYNGAYIVPLSVDIEQEAPSADPAIATIYERLILEHNLFKDGLFPKRGRLQITIALDWLVNVAAGLTRIATITEEAGKGQARVLRSGHSVDIFPSWASKLRVVEEVRKLIGKADAAVLSVGDSGDPQGNDYELLGLPLGLSVGRVCGRPGVCWNLLPPGIIGPEGLVRILAALKPTRPGSVRLDVDEVTGGWLAALTGGLDAADERKAP